MPSPITPEEQRQVKPFDPVVLDRTVIAVPLLNEMKEDLRLIAKVEKRYPDASTKFNAALEFNPKFKRGVKDAREEVLKMAKTAKDEALESSKKRQPNASETPEQPAGNKLATDSNDEGEASKARHAALEEATEKQTIGPLLPKSVYSFTLMHAAVIRRLLAANERLAKSDDDHPKPKPIVRILPNRFEIIIDLNLEYPGGREAAREWVLAHIEEAKKTAKVRDAGQEIHFEKDRRNSQYLFARLEARAIQSLVVLDMEAATQAAQKIDADKIAAEQSAAAKTAEADTAKGGNAITERAAGETSGPVAKTSLPHKKTDPNKYRAIYHIWPDFEVSACINKSIATVKADAAQSSFSAHGTGITWAVMDSGVDNTHRHFAKYGNLDLPSMTWHKDFTVDGAGPFDDKNGHGTHVAGIIAGAWQVTPDAPQRPVAVSRFLKTVTKDVQDIEYQSTELDAVSGMAPQCKLVSLRVLDENGKGSVSNLIAAIDHVQEINGQGRRLLIHGVNMSLGYNFEPEWFACGQSPLCVEVDRLVKTGVVVVVAAGNTGYGTLKSTIGATTAGMALTINDPGNSDLAITVGSTHRDMPHVYGVSYFSSKGPTGDGRLKPDLVAPGEKIISCATGNMKDDGAKGRACDYVETSGTSMAAPHVSGVIAAFLSVRREFIGKAERVKEIFVSTATDLRRDRYFQGSGLVDLMRAIQSV